MLQNIIFSHWSSERKPAETVDARHALIRAWFHEFHVYRSMLLAQIKEAENRLWICTHEYWSSSREGGREVGKFWHLVWIMLQESCIRYIKRCNLPPRCTVCKMPNNFLEIFVLGTLSGSRLIEVSAKCANNNNCKILVCDHYKLKWAILKNSRA